MTFFSEIIIFITFILGGIVCETCVDHYNAHDFFFIIEMINKMFVWYFVP